MTNNNKMRSEIKQMWLDALRSGEYKQGQKALRTDDNFCCLGVLCDLHRKNSLCELNWLNFGKKNINSLQRYAGKEVSLPDIVINWSELNLHHIQNNILDKLADKNDSGSTFEEIAEIIEAEL